MKPNIYIYILVMAGVTYLIRMLPLALVKKEITSPFVKSFLYYVPYACLAAMTFPAILTATAGGILSGAVGLGAALIAAYREKSLLTVALIACAAVFVAERIMGLIV
ncbi:MAG: AzlD domain-containing protein [Eubacteriales bacterium]|nr:AzlD domain-containing protein [Eubacteriales bacterium]